MTFGSPPGARTDNRQGTLCEHSGRAHGPVIGGHTGAGPGEIPCAHDSLLWSAPGTVVPDVGLLVDVGDAVGILVPHLLLVQAAVDTVAAFDEQRGQAGGDQ